MNAVPTTYPHEIAEGEDRDDGVVNCRAGYDDRETLGHVLQECFHAYRLRIVRHNTLVSYLADCIQKLTWRVLLVAHYRAAVGTRISDLELRRDGTSVSLDVHVVGTSIPMYRSHDDKVSYYIVPNLLSQIQGGCCYRQLQGCLAQGVCPVLAGLGYFQDRS